VSTIKKKSIIGIHTFYDGLMADNGHKYINNIGSAPLLEHINVKPCFVFSGRCFVRFVPRLLHGPEDPTL
jgi:hypothetical protein